MKLSKKGVLRKMTSKDALNNFNFIIHNCAETGKVELILEKTNYPKPIGDLLLESYEVIEKDLEVLEHLKLLFNGYKVLEKLNILYTDMYLLCNNSKDDVIKRWLDDDIH